MRWPNCSRFTRREERVPRDHGEDLATLICLSARTEQNLSNPNAFNCVYCVHLQLQLDTNGNDAMQQKF